MPKELRPTTSKVLSAIFSMVGPNGFYGKKVIDMFAGTGNFGISSIKRGASEVTFLEINKKRCKKISDLLKQFPNDKNLHVINGNIPTIISRISHTADIIFIDPPYNYLSFEKIMQSLEENNILKPGSLIFIEHSSKITLPDFYSNINLVKRKKYGDSAVTFFHRKIGNLK